MNFSSFINNAALLMVLSMLSANIQFRWLKSEPLKSIILGILYGLFSMAAMTIPMVLQPGVIFDGRSVVLSLAGFFTGNIATAIACVTAGAYRLYLGGPGTFTGIGSVLISGSLGIMFKKLVDAKGIRINPYYFLLFGFVVHAVLVGWFFTFPIDIALLIIKNVSIPYLLIFPIATMLIGGFIDGQQQRFMAEENLVVSEKKYRDLVETINEGIGIISAEAIIAFVNPKLAEMIGYKPKEIIGQPLHKFIDKGDYAEVKSLIKQRKKGFKNHHQYEMLISGRRQTYALINSTPLFDDADEYTGSLIGVQDITDRKIAEEKLADQARRLEKMVEERTKDLKEAQEQLIKAEKMATLGELAGSVGHELRNPLAVIANSVYLLKSSLAHVNPQTKEYIDIVEKELHNASQIITDLLNFSRIQPAEKEAVKLPTFFSEIWERIPVPENIEIDCDISEKMPPIYVNSQQLDQIFINLFSNACEAMGNGGKLSIKTKQVKNKLRVDVIDTGVGIPKVNMKDIFKPLFSTKARGVGLGLPIVLRLTELNDGKICVKSKVGQGTTFTLEFPLAES